MESEMGWFLKCSTVLILGKWNKMQKISKQLIKTCFARFRSVFHKIDFKTPPEIFSHPSPLQTPLRVDCNNVPRPLVIERQSARHKNPSLTSFPAVKAKPSNSQTHSSAESSGLYPIAIYLNEAIETKASLGQN